jgi:hypothetical protein
MPESAKGREGREEFKSYDSGLMLKTFLDDSLGLKNEPDMPDADYLFTPYVMAGDALYLKGERYLDTDQGRQTQKAIFRIVGNGKDMILMDTSPYTDNNGEQKVLTKQVDQQHLPMVSRLSDIAYFVARISN